MAKDKVTLRQRHQRGAVHSMEDLTPDSQDLSKLARRLSGKIGLDISLLSPEDKQAVLKVMTLMQDDSAIEASYAVARGEPLTGKETVFRRPSRCPTCGSNVLIDSADEGTNSYRPYIDRLGLCNEYASEVRRRAFAMMGANPLLKADIAWSRAMDLELYKLAGQALDEQIDPW